MQIWVVNQADQNRGNLTGLKMKALLIFMWNVKWGMSKYDNMMVIERGEYAKIWQYDGHRGGGMPKYDSWWQ